MYDLIYPRMVEAGVAIKLDQPVYNDVEGNVVEGVHQQDMVS